MTITELPSEDPSDHKCRTYVFENETHTLGNALRSIISTYPDVVFCGYTVPHPSEEKMNFRIQTSGTRAVDVLKRGFKDLDRHCEHIADVFQKEVELFKSAAVS